MSLPVDDQGLLRCIETIAHPKTKFMLLKQCTDFIMQVETADYPCTPLFVDSRFLKLVNNEPSERKKELPSSSKILEGLEKLVGASYIWGGNCSRGIPELLEFYPPKSILHKEKERLWTLKGVDCSGLLYQATDGFTPRNTSWLTQFGKPVLIENLSAKEICKLVRPLDLIVWHGHVIVILDSNAVIESRGGAGVVIGELCSRLEELAHELKKNPSNQPPISNKDYFVIRRWAGKS